MTTLKNRKQIINVETQLEVLLIQIIFEGHPKLGKYISKELCQSLKIDFKSEIEQSETVHD